MCINIIIDNGTATPRNGDYELKGNNMFILTTIQMRDALWQYERMDEPATLLSALAVLAALELEGGAA